MLDLLLLCLINIGICFPLKSNRRNRRILVIGANLRELNSQFLMKFGVGYMGLNGRVNDYSTPSEYILRYDISYNPTKFEICSTIYDYGFFNEVYVYCPEGGTADTLISWLIEAKIGSNNFRTVRTFDRNAFIGM